MNEINLAPLFIFLPLFKEVGIPIGIVAGSFVLRKIAQILEKLFKTLEEFLDNILKGIRSVSPGLSDSNSNQISLLIIQK